MLRRIARKRDSGAGAIEYAGLIVLAALILGTLVAVGIPSKVGPAVSGAICRVLHEDSCPKPQAAGNPDGSQSPGGQHPSQSPGQHTTGGDSDLDPSGQLSSDEGSDEPTLGDLQNQADKAQQKVDDLGDPNDIKDQIFDLLKDFIGVTDVEKCFGDGDFVSCLWAALDVGSIFFAILKAGKAIKAVKGAIKLWKDFNKARKALDRAKNSAKRLKELLRRKRLACGLPAAYSLQPHAPPGHVPHLQYADLPSETTVRVTHAAAPAAPGPTCGLNPKQVAEELSKAKRTGRAGLRAQESLGGHTLERHVGKSKKELLDRLKNNARMTNASTFSSYKTADKAVGTVLKKRGADIKDWLSAGSPPRLRLDESLGKKLGISVSRNGTSKTAKSVRVILERDPSSPNGYHIVTSFPTP